MKTGIELIADERERQISEEGWDVERDTQYKNNELVRASYCYLAVPFYVKKTREGKEVPYYWPWDAKWWKPTPDDRIRELQKAGALIAAELDRLQRIRP